MNVRKLRVEQEIQKELGSIMLRDVNDPRITGVTITGVNVTGDLQHATIYFSILSDKASDVEKAEAGLNKSKGLMRKLLAQRIRMFKVPEIKFVQDESIRSGSKIDELINKLNIED